MIDYNQIVNYIMIILLVATVYRAVAIKVIAGNSGRGLTPDGG